MSSTTSTAPANGTAFLQTLRHTMTVQGGFKALEFYKSAFGATITDKFPSKDGTKLMHATINVRGTQFYISDEMPEMDKNHVAPPKLDGKIHGNASISFGNSLAELDACYESALLAGATTVMHPSDKFYGMRSARVMDPFGHMWTLAANISKERVAAAPKADEKDDQPYVRVQPGDTSGDGVKNVWHLVTQ